ncbi:cupin domain-containing protein [Flavobacterium enshiense]|nr:cupin domain-containing protein [Flavobacterium enshiense]UOK41778.1 cupin domain-containing protein [Flavobacterium enshiense]
MFVLLLFTLGAVAQDKKIESNNMGSNKMMNNLVDNKLIHAVEISIEPGQKTDMHTHPAHFYYALSDGKIMIHYKDGKDELMVLTTGVSGYGDPERPHVTENVGETTVKFLIVELKEHPYKEAKPKK